MKFNLITSNQNKTHGFLLFVDQEPYFLRLFKKNQKDKGPRNFKSKQDPQNFIFKKKVRKYKKLVIDKWKERFRFFLLEALYGDEEDRKGFLGIYKGKE